MPSSALLGGALDRAAWYGGISTTCGCWTGATAPGFRSRNDLLERHGSLLAADVGMIMHYTDGPPRPYVLYLFWDPERLMWRLDGLLINNYRPGPKVGPCIVY